MQVSFFTSLRQAAGHKSVEFDLPAPVSVRQLIREILDEIPRLKAELVNDQR